MSQTYYQMVWSLLKMFLHIHKPVSSCPLAKNNIRLVFHYETNDVCFWLIFAGPHNFKGLFES